MINAYDKRYEIELMTDAEREALPRIENNNGRDYASCPVCRHYHAMMPADAYPEGGKGPFRFNYCRDCGALGIVVEASPAQEWAMAATDFIEDDDTGATSFDDGGEPTDEELEAAASVDEGGKACGLCGLIEDCHSSECPNDPDYGKDTCEACGKAYNSEARSGSEYCDDDCMELATDKITISKHDYDVLIENSVRLGELEGRLDKDIPLDSIFVPCNERISTDGDVCGKDRGHAGEHGPTKAQFERLCTQAAGALSNEWGEPEQVDAENAFWTTYEAMGFVPDEKYNLKATTQEAISAAIANAFLIISERRREQPPPPKRNPWEWSPDGYAKVVRGLRELEKELSGRRTPSQTSEASGTAQDGNKGQSTVTVTTEQTDTNRQETYSWIETKTEIDGRRREITTEVYHDATLTIERYGSATLVHEAERENGIMEDVNEFDLRSPARTSLLIFTSATMEAFAEFLDEYPEFEAELGKRWKVIVSDVAKEESVNV